MFPRARDGHQVGGEFPKNHFDLLMRSFPYDMLRVGCGIWAFTLLVETVSDIVLGFEVWMRLGRGAAFS